MNKTSLTIPAGIRYLSQWSDFHLSNFPAKCIINKVIPGCGFTRFCIETPWENVILCSPRKMLLQNKYEQHSSLCYLVVNEDDQDPGVDQNLAKEKRSEGLKTIDLLDDPTKNHYTQVKSRLHTELREYLSSHIQHKILVTYDSFRILKEVLEEMGIFQNFKVVIDEFQAIMQDSRFKSSTEINFLYHLQNSHSALFVSATPMMEKYLDELPEFRDLPYYELDWKSKDWTRVSKPNLIVKKMDNIQATSKKILSEFLAGNLEKTTILNKLGVPEVKYAKEVVFYVNSVSSIIQIIKSNDLESDQVNILCSNTEYNQKKINQKLGKKRGFTIGRVPLEGEPRKPITLCTRTVYLGADFYSDQAISYIFSDSNSDYLSVDISMDLPQILGRQRCDENPWKNSATLFYKTTADYNKFSKADFDRRINEKKDKTKVGLMMWDKLLDTEKNLFSEKCLSDINVKHYKEDYISVNRVDYINPETNQKEHRLMVVENNLVLISEKRAFDIQQYDYADRFSVFSSISSEFKDGFNKESSDDDPIEMQVREFLNVYEKLTRVCDKLKLLCEAGLTEKAREVVLAQLSDSDKVKSMYILAGPERCKADKYVAKTIAKSIGIKYFSKKEIAEKIYQVFSPGESYTLTSIKSTLSNIYTEIMYDKTPKATDLFDFFEIKEYMTTDPKTKKRIRGYHLIKKLL